MFKFDTTSTVSARIANSKGFSPVRGSSRSMTDVVDKSEDVEKPKSFLKSTSGTTAPRIFITPRRYSREFGTGVRVVKYESYRNSEHSFA